MSDFILAIWAIISCVVTAIAGYAISVSDRRFFGRGTLVSAFAVLALAWLACPTMPITRDSEIRTAKEPKADRQLDSVLETIRLTLRNSKHDT